MEESGLFVRIAFFIGGIVALLFLLNLVLMREWVKEDLRKRGAVPESIRWSLLGPGLGARWSYFGTFYKVRYRTLLGIRHEGFVLVPPASWGKVRWIVDDVVNGVADGLFNLD